ncbi:MAG: hypothetical protein OXE98_06950 [Hyphomicrobiales bacterium]|nr:hypothetical protein [Hyphomicrobiales bacterium]
MNTSLPKNIPEDIPAPKGEALSLSEEMYRVESDEILLTVHQIILNSIQRGGRLIPLVTVVFIIITTVGVIAALFTWLYHMLVGEKLWWLSKEQVMQIHAYISGLLNGWSSLGLFLLLRYYFYSRHNSN